MPITISQRSGDPTAPTAGFIRAATADGRYVFFGATAPLTEGTQEEPEEFVEYTYRYDVDSGELLNLTPSWDETGLAPKGSEVIASGDGGTAYFTSPAVLAPGAPVGEENKLYAWRDGALRFVAALDHSEFSLGASALSPDASNLAFVSRAKLTEYDNGNPAACGGQSCSEVISATSMPIR